jgi:hypothetical protein
VIVIAPAFVAVVSAEFPGIIRAARLVAALWGLQSSSTELEIRHCFAEKLEGDGG